MPTHREMYWSWKCRTFPSATSLRLIKCCCGAVCFRPSFHSVFNITSFRGRVSIRLRHCSNQIVLRWQLRCNRTPFVSTLSQRKSCDGDKFINKYGIYFTNVECSSSRCLLHAAMWCDKHGYMCVDPNLSPLYGLTGRKEIIKLSSIYRREIYLYRLHCTSVVTQNCVCCSSLRQRRQSFSMRQRRRIVSMAINKLLSKSSTKGHETE